MCTVNQKTVAGWVGGRVTGPTRQEGLLTVFLLEISVRKHAKVTETWALSLSSAFKMSPNPVC